MVWVFEEEEIEGKCLKLCFYCEPLEREFTSICVWLARFMLNTQG